jgi:hypothetical protein
VFSIRRNVRFGLEVDFVFLRDVRSLLLLRPTLDGRHNSSYVR